MGRFSVIFFKIGLIYMIFESYASEINLIHHLRKNFTKIRPVVNGSKPLTVIFGFELIQILKVREEEQSIEMRLWLRMEWMNELLKWDPRHFNGVKMIQVEKQHLWVPDIYAWEGISHTEDHETNIRVGNDGMSLWMIPVLLKTSCTFDIKDFPFDRQRCTIRWLSWTSDASQLLIQKDNRPIVTKENYIASSLFELHSITNHSLMYKFHCCPQKYSILRYSLVLDRHARYYVIHNLLPCAIQMLVILFSFRIPPRYGQRVSLCVTMLLVFAMHLKVLQDSLPLSSGSTPALSAFFLVCTVITVVSFILTVLVLSINYKGSRDNAAPVRLPYWARVAFLRYIGPCILASRDVKILMNIEERSDNHENNSHSIELTPRVPKRYGVEKEGTSRASPIKVISESDGTVIEECEIKEWTMLAKVLDRMCFVAMIFVFPLSWLIFLVPIFSNSHYLVHMD